MLSEQGIADKVYATKQNSEPTQKGDDENM